ncbi:MAG: tyrosine-protein phosphatase [Planctomycetes bacterium]|nr:tyrosine-protein phosphatase [Planctomycetota bacterium]
MKPTPTRRLWVFVALITFAATGATVAVWGRARMEPRRFDVVVEGKLYRSGLVRPAHLEHLQHQYGIRRIISLLNPATPESRAEEQAARRLGFEWHNIPLRGNGASTPEERCRILTLLRDPDAGPTLVHCAAGTNRTGLAIGLYRLHVQGWTLEAVMAEMRRFDFENAPHHQNLRDALAAEAAAAAANRELPTTRVATPP